VDMAEYSDMDISKHGDIIPTVIMMRDLDERAIILVEGNSDCSIIDPHLNKSAAQTYPADGKRNVEKVVQALLERNEMNIVGLADSDWTGTPWGTDKEPGIVYTELYDLEMDLLAIDGVIERVLSSHCTNKDFPKTRSVGEELEEMGTGSPFEFLVRIVSPLGVLRSISVEHGLRLNLRDFPLHVYIGSLNQEINIKELVSMAIKRTNNCKLDEEELLSLLEQRLKNAALPNARYCCGHDMCNALAFLAKKRWGGKLGQGQAERSVRASIGFDEFLRLTVKRDLDTWGQQIGIQVFQSRDCRIESHTIVD
jgi:hypothetical protein